MCVWLGICTTCVWGQHFDEFPVDGETYYDVTITNRTPRGFTFKHSKGFKQVLFTDLSPQERTLLGYDPAIEQAYLKQQSYVAKEERKRQKQERQELAQKRNSAKAPVEANGKTYTQDSARLLRSLGSPPTIEKEVDLRPKYKEYGLYIKNQGRRPSCTAYAVVSALELQYANYTGNPVRFSEEYLIWATRQVMGVNNTQESFVQHLQEKAKYREEGFTLPQVMNGLRSYGILPLQMMPKQGIGEMDAIDTPSDSQIEFAQTKQHIEFFFLTADDKRQDIEGIIQLLNQGVPVVVGANWIAKTNLHYLNKQSTKDGSRHAVTIVGYRNETGNIEDTTFYFKNSWGVHWGLGGYGLMTYDYVKENLFMSMFLTIQPSQ